MTWLESTADEANPVRVMAFTPETLDEWEEANLLYKITRWRPWKDFNELQLILQKPGPWLVRLNLAERYQFLSTTDQGLLADDQATNFSFDPHEAVSVDSPTAFNLIRQLSRAYELELSNSYIYLEPVEAKDAMTNFRESLMQEYVNSYTCPVQIKAKSEAIQHELARLKGSWKIVSCIEEGEETVQTMEEQVITFEKDKFFLHEDEEILEVKPFRIDPLKSPKWIHVAAGEEDIEVKGNCQLGIYKIDGDTLSSSISFVGRARPNDFTANKGSFRVVTRYKKVRG